MIELMSGDLFDSGADAIVIPVNAVGVTGAGLAKQWARRFPDAARVYRRACAEDQVASGDLNLWEPSAPASLTIATKGHWRAPSQIEWVINGLQVLSACLRKGSRGFRSVAIPALGCGLGGLQWGDVLPVIERELASWDGRVLVYGPRPEVGGR